MTAHYAELASTATGLDDLIVRVSAAAEAMAHDNEDIAADLYEVERSLRTGARRLASLLRQLGPG